MLEHLQNIRSTITPAAAQKELARHGMEVTLEEAKAMVEMLSILAVISLENENCLPLRPGINGRASR